MSDSPSIQALRFHDDFDGIASAALLLGAIEVDVPLDCRSVGYAHDRGSWLDTPLPKNAAVVDFLYHPEAAYWFDHHANPFVGGRSPADERHVWDPEAPSCAGLIARHFGMKGRWEDLASWADKIDAAGWDSPAETMDWSNPVVRIYNALLGPEFEPFAIHLIRLLGRMHLDDVAQDAAVMARAESARRLLEAGMVHLRSSAYLSNTVAIVECPRGVAPYVVPRYGAYLIFPDADYMLLNQQQTAGWKVTVSRNPWRKTSGPHLGEMVGPLGGGGHRDVAAINLETRERARATADVVRHLLQSSLTPATGVDLASEARKS